jgi:hypothetical protein
MPTLGEVRARLRRALEDTDATAPLWPDTDQTWRWRDGDLPRYG